MTNKSNKIIPDFTHFSRLGNIYSDFAVCVSLMSLLGNGISACLHIPRFLCRITRDNRMNPSQHFLLHILATEIPDYLGGAVGRHEDAPIVNGNFVQRSGRGLLKQTLLIFIWKR